MSEALAIFRASSQAPLSFSSEPVADRFSRCRNFRAFLTRPRSLRQLPSGLLVIAAPSGKPLFYNPQAARLLHLPAAVGRAEDKGAAMESDGINRAANGCGRARPARHVTSATRRPTGQASIRLPGQCRTAKQFIRKKSGCQAWEMRVVCSLSMPRPCATRRAKSWQWSALSTILQSARLPRPR